MSFFSVQASAATATTPGVGDLRTQEDLSAYINNFYDTLVDEAQGNIDNSMLVGMFREVGQSKDAEIVKTKVRGTAVAGINEDGDDMPFIQWGQGWEQTHRVYPYRIAVGHTLHLEEVDEIGTVGDEIRELMTSGERTIYYALADWFNRGIAPASYAPSTCIDGMYFIDSARPNPVVGVPNWSNEEDTTDVTEAALFQANLNAKHTLASNGDRMPRSIKKIIIPDAYDLVMHKLSQTPKAVGTAQNDVNWAAGRFPYETCVEFTGNTIYYQLSDAKGNDNELLLKWAQRFNVKDINFEDPDVIGKRLRFRFGIECKDPRPMWRGGMLNVL